MARLGGVVRHGERFGTLVRGPRPASRGMTWVLWEGSDKPVLMHRMTLAYVARRGPVEAVRATLRSLVAAGVVALCALASGGSGHAQVTTQPGGGVTCPDGYTAQRLNGQLVIVCPSTMTPEEARRFRLEQEQIREQMHQRDVQDAVRNGECGPDVPKFRRSPNCP